MSTRDRSLFERSPLPMWMYDRETLAFVAVNEAAVQHYGFTRDEFMRMTIADVRPPEDISRLVADVKQADGFSEPKTWRHRKKDGSLISVEVKANDFVEAGRNVRLVLVNDVTNRDRAERAIQEAQKMDAVGRLAGGVAHDFNNVLTVIQSYACMLESSLDETDARRDDAVEIRKAAERAAGITKQLLTMSRHAKVAPKSISLDAIVRGFETVLRRLLGDQISLVTHPSDAPLVVADPGQIEQVLMNLAVNARDAMSGGGRFTIETSVVDVAQDSVRGLHAGRYVVLAATDTGTGMDLETQRRMFEPFFTTKDVGKGTGLGLSIVHGIVAQAGGAISVYSELAHGTTFRIYLPVATTTIALPERESHVMTTTLPSISVLVVDDSREVRAVATRILVEAGCSVLEAATAEEARRLIVSHDGAIDVVVLDVVLSDGRGDLLVRQLVELRPRIKVVLMSGYPAGALTPSGGTPPDLLAKPFSPHELRAAVARALGDAAHPAPDPPSNPLCMRVLVVDDEADLRRVFTRVLRRANCDVVAVDSGRKAIAELETKKFDVILSDVHMPDGSGLDLVRAVRRVDLDVPVILMSGAPDVATAAKAVEYGAFRYLTKPIDVDALSTLVEHAARAHKLARLRRDAFSVTGAHPGAVDRAGLEVRFDAALEHMWMAFQPILDARNGALFGVEALMRSNEPSLPNPPALLDAATELDRLPHVGRRVRSLSAAAVAARTDQIALFVNLHPEDLFDVDLIDDAASLTQIAPRVILEVTERASLSGSTELTAKLAALRKLGFRLAVDDIGAGYSGLTSFTELMPEVVKIDMSLVRGAHQSVVKQRTIGALAKLCHEVGCLVVAEGIETIEEQQCVVDLGCDLLQGYLLGRPGRQLPP